MCRVPLLDVLLAEGVAPVELKLEELELAEIRIRCRFRSRQGPLLLFLKLIGVEVEAGMSRLKLPRGMDARARKPVRPTP